MSAYRSAELCPHCASEATTRDGTCLACGHVWGAAHRCAHCGESCEVELDAALGKKCSRCGLPRIARAWEMSKERATRLREAVDWLKTTKRVGRVALLVAVACMPLGLVIGNQAGFAGWLAVLILWMLSVALSSFMRRAGRRALAVQLAAGREEWERANPHLRVAALSAELPMTRVSLLEEEDVIGERLVGDEGQRVTVRATSPPRPR